MKKIICVALAAAGLIPAFSLPGYAWYGGHVRRNIWIGTAWRPVFPYYAAPPDCSSGPTYP